jgi:hypothetical protein
VVQLAGERRIDDSRELRLAREFVGGTRRDAEHVQRDAASGEL